MRELSTIQAAILGYILKLDDLGIRATRDHVVRFMAQVPERIRTEASLTYHLDALIKKNFITRPGVGYYAATPDGRSAHLEIMELLGVRHA